MKLPKKKANLTSDGLFDYDEPIGRHFAWILQKDALYNGESRDGVVCKGRNVWAWEISAMWARNTKVGFMNIIEELNNNYEAANDLWKQYKDRLSEFRSAVKNDVTSLEASARKTTEAVNKMTASYKGVLSLLNSPEMETAVQNAERLSVAMQALANLQSHKLVFAVTDQAKGE